MSLNNIRENVVESESVSFFEYNNTQTLSNNKYFPIATGFPIYYHIPKNNWAFQTEKFEYVL